MCLYYEYSVKYKGCKKDPKHLVRKEKDVYCKKVTEEGQAICQPVERIPWEFGSTTNAGQCPKCGKYSEPKFYLHSNPTQPTNRHAVMHIFVQIDSFITMPKVW